jgi:hypothetical protein
LDEAHDRVQRFKSGSLKKTIASLESSFRAIGKSECEEAIKAHQIGGELLKATLNLKLALAQINEVVHCVGILKSLPHILEPEEKVTYLSLGAGNTGKPFDLETSSRIAEFKFIDWKGGSESIRQNALFKDFFYLAEYPTHKRRFLYVVGLKHPMKFFNGGRACTSVMSKNRQLWADYSNKYSEFLTVCAFYGHKRANVEIVDLATIIPEFAAVIDLVDEITKQ